MADIERCKKDGFIAFHIQMSAHFRQHPELDYFDKENTEDLGNSDADYKRYGFRPSIEYYKAKYAFAEAHLNISISPFDFEKGGKFEKKGSWKEAME